MADLATAIVKLAETLEKFYPILDQMNKIQQQNQNQQGGASPTQKQDGDTTSTTKDKDAGDSSGAGFGSSADMISSLVSGVTSAAKQTWGMLQQGENSPYGQLTKLKPIELMEAELQADSRAGITYTPQEAELRAKAVKNLQNITKSNVDEMDPRVDRGLTNNISREIDKFTASPWSETVGIMDQWLHGPTTKAVSIELNPGIKAANINHLGGG